MRTHRKDRATWQFWIRATRISARKEEGRNGGKISVVNSRAVSRGQNELTGDFKMAAGDVISIRG